jgi:hypothetical protein
VIVRLLALLFTVGLLAGTVQARELSAPQDATAALVQDGGIDADDHPAATLVTPPEVPMPEPRVDFAWAPSPAPAVHRHCCYVFRPPRVPTFN